MEAEPTTSVRGVDLKKYLTCCVILAPFCRQILFLRLMKHSSVGLSAQVVLTNAGWVTEERAKIAEQVRVNKWCKQISFVLPQTVIGHRIINNPLECILPFCLQKIAF